MRGGGGGGGDPLDRQRRGRLGDETLRCHRDAGSLYLDIQRRRCPERAAQPHGVLSVGDVAKEKNGTVGSKSVSNCGCRLVFMAASHLEHRRRSRNGCPFIHSQSGFNWKLDPGQDVPLVFCNRWKRRCLEPGVPSYGEWLADIEHAGVLHQQKKEWHPDRRENGVCPSGKRNDQWKIRRGLI